MLPFLPIAMSEPAFREIQLTKKQLVFVFMASVVLAAVVFLLGVSLGRRLPASAAASGQAAEPSAEVIEPAEMPPPTVLTPGDQAYASELQGGKVPPPEPQPPPATTTAGTAKAAPAAQAPTPAGAGPAATSRAEPARPAPAPVKAPAAAPAEPPASGGLFLQVNAFRSRANAETEVRRLAEKGHKAVVSPSGSLFRVRVGPFADRAAADKAMAALRRDGFSPQVTGR